MTGSDSKLAVAGGPARHIPVLGRTATSYLNVRDGGVYIDATFGAGSYSREILAAARASVIAIDRDPRAVASGAALARNAGGRFVLTQSRFSRLEAVAQSAGHANVDGAVFDLGVSSMQLDRPERGFSYAADAPLDMRMDPTQDVSACDVVNGWSERDLVTIFRRYGEERYAKQIARAIVRRRREQPFERTGELVDTIRAAIPAPARFGEGHPAKRVFQALRIAVNDELDSLATALPSALEMLRPGGRLAVISFHSLEDRIVKRFLRERERGCTCPPDFPVCVCGHEPELRALQRRPIRPGHAELAANPRSASARLRAAIKTGPEEA